MAFRFRMGLSLKSMFGINVKIKSDELNTELDSMNDQDVGILLGLESDIKYASATELGRDTYGNSSTEPSSSLIGSNLRLLN